MGDQAESVPADLHAPEGETAQSTRGSDVRVEQPAEQPATTSGNSPAIKAGLEGSHSESDGAAEPQKSFAALARELRPDLYRYAFWLSRDAALADDVVQEALLRGWRAFGSLKDQGSVKQWLLTIVRREHARMHERKKLDTTEIDEIGATERDLIAATEDPDLQAVRLAIFRLPDDYREPLVLQVLLGHTTEEIADLLGLEQGTVLTRLFRARRKLRAQLGVEGGE